MSRSNPPTLSRIVCNFGLEHCQRIVEPSACRPAHHAVLLSDAVAQLSLAAAGHTRTALLSLQPLLQLGLVRVGGVQLLAEHLNLRIAHTACDKQE